MAELIWRLLNYLCLGMLYLKDNVILNRDPRMDDFKERIVGHWGTCPAINAIYAHLTDYCLNYKRQVKLIIGTGHSAPSLLAASFLDGTLSKYYPDYKRNAEGLKKLCNAYGTYGGFSSEIDANYPGTIYCGGELGESLAFSQGYIFNHPERIVACIIGDGEFETPVCQAAFQGFQFIEKNRDGQVLPIINLNGYKMGCKSTLAGKSNKQLSGYFKFFNMEAVFADTNHSNISGAFKCCFDLLKNGRFPVLILRTPKGWTAPAVMGGMVFEGSYKSHKPMLTKPASDNNEFQEVKEWLKSYSIQDFFTENGLLIHEITDYLDVIGTSVIDFMRNYSDRRINISCHGRNKSNPDSCSDFLHKWNSDSLIVFSPDELNSNGFGSIRDSCRVIELLSEQVCFGWCHGYAAGGNVTLLITYEAFAPLFDSMVDQYLKSLNLLNPLGCQMPSVNIIITSLGWKNVPSHHNPSFVDRLLSCSDKSIRIYFPLSPENSSARLKECFESNNLLNLIVMDKRNLPRLYETSAEAEEGYFLLRDNNDNRSYLLVIVIGDIVAEETLKSYDSLSSMYQSTVRIIGLENLYESLKLIKDESSHLHRLLDSSVQNIWIYNGKSSAFSSILWRFGFLPTKNLVLGYNGNSVLPPGYFRLHENGLDHESISITLKKIIEKRRLSNVQDRQCYGSGVH